MKCLTLITLIVLLAALNCEKYSAIIEMEKLAHDEDFILAEFESFVNEMEMEIKYLASKLSNWSVEYEVVREDVIKYITNPLNAFAMIARTTADIALIESRLTQKFQRFRSSIEKLQPSAEDLTGAVEGLLRLQQTYKLKTSEITSGIIAGEAAGRRMTPHELYTVAVEAQRLNESFFVNEYLSECRKALLRNEDHFGEVSVKAVSVLSSENLMAPKVDPFQENFVRNNVYTLDKERVLYAQICRKEGLKSPKELASLKCRYISNSHFSKIAPFKVEEADLHSSLVVFHDIISDAEIEILKQISRKKLYRGTIIANNSSIKANSRVAQISWIKDEEYEVVERLSRRIEDMTGLTMETAEELQVQNYGIGGHYFPHWDMRIKRDGVHGWKGGNRIATVLIYLSTVEKGGATVFPFLKVHVPAVRGTAVFWYNLRDNGDDDYYTRHAACPVLIGSKWVANKWIHEHGQERRRPCTPGAYVESSETETMNGIF